MSNNDVAAPLSPEERVRWDVIVAAIAFGVIILDQTSKALVVSHFSGIHTYDVVSILGNVLTIVYDQNTGAAFSSFVQAPLLLGLLILLAICVIGWLYWTTRSRANLMLKITFGLIIGGALGNLIDRWRHGYVVDFVHFQLPGLHHFDFAIFNVADSAISLGVIGLAITFWRMQSENNQPTAQTSSELAVSPVGKPAEHRNASTAARTPKLTQAARPIVRSPIQSGPKPLLEDHTNDQP